MSDIIENMPRKKYEADIPTDLEYESSRLQGLCKEANVSISLKTARELIDLLVLVMRQNETLNLTAIKEWDKALTLHLVDSLILLPEFDGTRDWTKPYLDMGCGAGFPGLPLALARHERTTVLCDSVKKKIAAVDRFIADLGIEAQVTTTSERLESLGQARRGEFSCITARALASLPVLIEYATPLLAKRGRLIAVKGRPDQNELEDGKKVADLCGLEIRTVRTLELPGGMGERTILVYEKVAESTVRLPRCVGEATKKPLLEMVVSRETSRKRR